MRTGVLLLGAALLACANSASAPGAPVHVPLAIERSSPQDLEISGIVPGIPEGQKRYVRYEDLARLPQVSFNVKDDANFSGVVKLSGVPLDELLQAIGPGAGRQLIAAICVDGYEAHYTAEYRAAHHPFLVLRIGGQAPAQWPKGPDGENYGPYVISHPHFTPVFHVQAQPEEAQIPYGVVGLKIFDEAAVWKELRPPGSSSLGSPAMLGAQIAATNCLRCHRDGDIGGVKSPFGWPQMALIAQGKPDSFEKYVLRPNSVNPEANMPANPEYDAATLAALTAYFRSFAPEVKK
jgi:mono/diheme cytochrome c family protein